MHPGTNLRYPNYLTLWDIAHRSAGYFPESTDEHNLPESVAESLTHWLQLAQNSLPVLKYRDFNDPKDLMPDEDEDEEMSAFDVFTLMVRTHLFSSWRHKMNKRFKLMCQRGQFNKSLLDSLYIPRESVRRMALHRNLLLPDFWFDPEEIQAIDERKRIIHPDPVCNSDSGLSVVASHERVALARKGAEARHSEANQVKEAFIDYYETQCQQHGRRLSVAKAAPQFQKVITEDQFRAVCPSRKMDNFVRTLREYLKKTKESG